MLEVETNSESVILNEFSSDWVLESLLSFKFSSMRIICRNYYKFANA